MNEEQPKLSPEELLAKMAVSAAEFEEQNRIMRKLWKQKMFKAESAKILIMAKKPHLLQNEALKTHLSDCLKDEKFKITLELLASFVYLECRPITEQYEEAEMIAKQAEKEHEMWSRQLSWYQSQLKLEGIEIMTLGNKT